MPDKSQKASLRDVLNYQPPQLLSDAELAKIKAVFKNDEVLMNVLRKVLIPTIYDPALPMEMMGSDVYFQNREWASIPADEAKILMVARQDAIKFILGGLIQLKILANEKQESEMEAALRRSKDSAK